MKINNETKVGILAIVAILALVLGFNFLKGKSLFSKTPVLYAVFANLGGLEKSNVVKINGLPVGTVYDYKPVDKEVNSIVVEIHLTRDIDIPANSIAYINATLVGASNITIEKGDANSYLQVGDTINTRLEAGIMGDIRTQLSPTISKVNDALDSLKLIMGSVNEIFDPSTNNNLQTMIARLSISTAYLQEILNTQSGALAQSLNNLNAVTGNLAKNNDAITSTIRNVEVTTSNLANARIPQTVAALEGTVNELKGTIQRLDNNINNNKGTLGKLMNDSKLYNQLTSAALGLEVLLDDIRIHPERYVNVSVFGGKSKPEPITSPAAKDSIPVSY